MGKIKKLILFLIVLIPLAIYFFYFTSEAKGIEKTSDKVIVDGAKFTVEFLADPVQNMKTPLQFKVINGATQPDPEICILNLSVNKVTVLEDKKCIGENETLELFFDYETKEDEIEWSILAFYSVEQETKNVTMLLKKKPAEEGYKVSLIMSLPDTAERGSYVKGSATFTSGSSNWINTEKAVLILKKEDHYYNFEKVLNYLIPPNFHYTTDYSTTLPSDIETGNYVVQGIFYYTENKIEKAVSCNEQIEIV